MSRRGHRGSLFAVGIMVPLLLSCENINYPVLPGELLALDVLDYQRLEGSKPNRQRLYEGGMAKTIEPAGPDLGLRFYLSAELSASSLARASLSGFVIRDEDGQQVVARSFRNEDNLDPLAEKPEATRQALTLLPDLRSSRKYVLYSDRNLLVTERGDPLSVPASLSLQTARRFLVLRSEPPSGKSVLELSDVKLIFSAPVNERFSGKYEITITHLDSGKVFPYDAQLLGDKRTLQLRPHCSLPKGAVRIEIQEGGAEEDSTLVPLSEGKRIEVAVTEDPGPCREEGDMRPQGDLGAPDLRTL